MKFLESLLMLSLLLLDVAYSKDRSAESSVDGIIVQFKRLEDVGSLAFKDFLKNNDLELVQQNEKFRMALLKHRSAPKIEHTPDKKALQLLCQEAKLIGAVTSCDLNERLEPNNDLCSQEPTNEVVSMVASLLDPVTRLTCELLTASPRPHGQEGLSTYWAQEYTGGDLLRQRIEASAFPAERFQNLFSIWDSSELDHGTQVSHLIQSPERSATIPGPQQGYTSSATLWDMGLATANHVEACGNSATCPRYINHSIAWNTLASAQFIEQASEPGTIFIDASGNGGGSVNEFKRQQAREDHIILVSSCTSEGKPSSFSDTSPEVSICAPSNREVTSFDSSGAPSSFGGTSGAAPQVTSALAAFTLISGYSLSTREAKKLLERTALPMPGMLHPNMFGHGMLNTYKIGELAYRAQSLCQNQAQKERCVRRLLSTDGFYRIQDGDGREALRAAKEAFPNCATPAQPNEQAATANRSCDERRSTLERLRKASLLNSEDPELWSTLGCIVRQEQALAGNATYYDNMAQHLRRSKEETYDRLVASRDDMLLIGVIEHPRWRRDAQVERSVSAMLRSADREDLLLQMVLRPSVKDEPRAAEILEHLMQQTWPQQRLVGVAFLTEFWQRHPRANRLFEQYLPTSPDDRIVAMLLSLPRWQRHPRAPAFIETLARGGKADLVVADILYNEERFRRSPSSQAVFELIAERNPGTQQIVNLLQTREFRTHPRAVEFFDTTYRTVLQREDINHVTKVQLLYPLQVDSHWSRYLETKIGRPFTFDKIRDYYLGTTSTQP
jgi:hypothetical protein